VLDYTARHRFTVRLDRANGTGWQPLSKKLHGALSGGEKAIALHLPLFAAVAAHYEAVPLAPRPILLDEVFVGVDAVNRGQVFALLTALDPAGESAAAEVRSTADRDPRRVRGLKSAVRVGDAMTTIEGVAKRRGKSKRGQSSGGWRPKGSPRESDA